MNERLYGAIPNMPARGDDTACKRCIDAALLGHKLNQTPSSSVD